MIASRGIVQRLVATSCIKTWGIQAKGRKKRTKCNCIGIDRGRGRWQQGSLVAYQTSITHQHAEREEIEREYLRMDT